MKIWLPYIKTSSGGDVAIKALAAGLESVGHQVLLQHFPHFLQYIPWVLRMVHCPDDTDLVISTDWWAFAFKRTKIPLVVVIHGFMCDPVYRGARSFIQAVFHETIIRHCYMKTQSSADTMVTVSEYTADTIQEQLGGERITVIYNGIDTSFFCPGDNVGAGANNDKKTVLFVGNLLRRKGATLFPEIMAQLGPDYELRYTTGWRSNTRLPDNDGFTNLGLLDKTQLRAEYRAANLLLFPTRLESFALPVAEAMACGLPVVTSNCAALPELVLDNVTGMLCEPGSVEEYVLAIKKIFDSPEVMHSMGKKARARAVEYFDHRQSLARYVTLVEGVVREARE